MRIVVSENTHMTTNKRHTSIDNNEAFMEKVENLVKEIVAQNDIPYYRIESEMEYGDVAHTPVIKVVTYFENSVSPIAAILCEEFDVEADEAANKQAITTDSFASKRIAYRLALKANRLQLTEYKKFSANKFKVYVCSVLQDTWAGLEKELGYNGGNIPDEAKRDFYRVGALMEMADLEFLKIRAIMNKNEARPKTVKTEEYRPLQQAPVAEQAALMDENRVLLRVVPTKPQQQKNTETSGNGASSKVNIADNGYTNGAEQTSELSFTRVPRPQSATYIPPVPEKQADPVHFNFDSAGRLNVSAEGLVEKTQTPQQPAPDERYPANGQRPLDEYAQMTDASLKEYVLNSKLLKEVDSQIAAHAGARLNNDIDIEGDVERLKFLKVYSLKQLHEKIIDNKADIVAFAEKWIGKDNGGSFDMGISLFYLEYLLVAKKNDLGFAVEYVLKFISDNEYSARYIVPTYEAIRDRDTDVNASKFAHLTLK
jgi:ppGpp synthetase/RelA/SpoT-type nucleotidyltranferase